MDLRYATVTGVARTTCRPGAWLYAETVRADPRGCRDAGGVLIPDFSARDLLSRSLRSPRVDSPTILETVPRLMRRIRPAFRYDRSLAVLHGGQGCGPGSQVQT